jgi:hypothetical protein
MIYVAVGRVVPLSEDTSLVPVSVTWVAASMMNSTATDNAFRRSISRCKPRAVTLNHRESRRCLKTVAQMAGG